MGFFDNKSQGTPILKKWTYISDSFSNRGASLCETFATHESIKSLKGLKIWHIDELFVTASQREELHNKECIHIPGTHFCTQQKLSFQT